MRWLLVPIAAVALAAAGCGGDDDDGPAGTVTVESVGEDVQLAGPPSLYAPSLEEMLAPSVVNVAETYAINPTTYATTGGFGSPNTGQERAEEWGYNSGYQVLYDADGLVAGAATGNYYTTVQVFLFDTAEGARGAFNFYEERGRVATDSEAVDIERVGNQSAAAVVGGERTLPGTTIPGEFHRVVFRRGNMVTIVQTFGASEFMSIVQAREIAVIVDQRAMGERPAEEPTPIERPSSPVT